MDPTELDYDKLVFSIRSDDAKSIMLIKYIMQKESEKVKSLLKSATKEEKIKMLNSAYLKLDNGEKITDEYIPYNLAAYNKDIAILDLLITCALETGTLDDMLASSKHESINTVYNLAVSNNNVKILNLVLSYAEKSCLLSDMLASNSSGAIELVGSTNKDFAALDIMDDELEQTLFYLELLDEIWAALSLHSHDSELLLGNIDE